MVRKNLVVVVSDSITNSVFESQVIARILKHDIHTYHVTLISYERHQPPAALIVRYQNLHPHLTIIIKKRLPYLGMISLLPAALHLKCILASFSSYALRARGALAGMIALQAHTKKCTALTIQVRGLLAAEYEYEHKNQMSLMHRMRAALYAALERKVYTSGHAHLEAVSKALADHLTKHYQTNQSSITIAIDDIPTSFSPACITGWKKETRQELGIPDNATVYCYSGSAKPWQCPEKSIAFVHGEFKKNSATFLLILSPDVATFSSLLASSPLPPHAYRIICVRPHDLYRYLAAADYGILFREAHIINWTSRPTKALEYRAVGLKIIHNNTIAYLLE